MAEIYSIRAVVADLLADVSVILFMILFLFHSKMTTMMTMMKTYNNNKRGNIFDGGGGEPWRIWRWGKESNGG